MIDQRKGNKPSATSTKSVLLLLLKTSKTEFEPAQNLSPVE